MWKARSLEDTYEVLRGFDSKQFFLGAIIIGSSTLLSTQEDSMRRSMTLAIILVSFLFPCFAAHRATAQRAVGGVIRGGVFPHAAVPGAPFPAGSFAVTFPATPVNTTSIQDCYFNCFFQSGSPPESCNYSGVIQLAKFPAAPFRWTNTRKGIVGSGCSGSPVTVPLFLQAGERLLQDFEFFPTTPGTFQDSLVFLVTPTASPLPTETFSWLLSGSAVPQLVTFGAVPAIIRLGQGATLSWITNGASSVVIDNGVGTVSASASVTVTPSSTTTYTLTAMSGSLTATATATITVITAPQVVVSVLPQPILQTQGLGGGTATYTVTNAGGSATTVNVSQSGSFFTQSPSSFTLNAGASQAVTITANALSSGAFEGSAILSGNGVPAGLQVPVKVLVTDPPATVVVAKPPTNRVDVTQPSGTVSFTNNGDSTLSGILVSDQSWLIPQGGIVTIPSRSTASFTFTIDRSKRPDADALVGSAAGNISLVYLGGPAAKIGSLQTTPPPSVSTVSVVDTVPLSVSSTGPPPLAAGEVALFVPGVGHITGSVGTFISDISVLNPPGTKPINDVKFFYTSVSGATQKSTSLPPVSGVSVALADVVKNVFATDAQVGSLQIRSADAVKLLVNTNIFVSSNPVGTFGTTIPTFRSDRAVAPGDRLVLSGLRQDSGVHTNLFIQETSGVGVTVQTEFLGPDGNTLATRSDTVGPFALSQINNVAPSGAVAAILTNSSANGRFLAYATPIDNLSSDNWSVVDWSRQFGYSGGEPTIIPVAGLVHGANNSFFRTDISITATGTGQASATLRYISRAEDGINKTAQVTLGSRQTRTVNDVISTLFGVTTDTVGFIQVTPVTGTFAITSRTYSTKAIVPGTFGTGVPTLAASQSLKAGSIRAIGSLEDASVSTIVAQRGATFRTNFALLETTGNSVRMRVTLRFSYPAGTKVQAIGSAFKDYSLSPNQFLLVNGIANDILGSNRSTLGDLRGLEADFQVLEGSGALAVFTSSIDNGTADQILRSE